MRIRFVCFLVAVALGSASCGSAAETDSTGTTSAPLATAPVTEAVAAPPDTAAPTTAPATTAAPAEPGIGFTTIDFVDTTRPTDEFSNGDAVLVEASDSRLLQTTIRYPANGDGQDAESLADGRPLIIVSHGLGGTPAYVTPVADVLVEAGYVVALPLYPESPYGAASDYLDQPADVSFIIDQIVELSGSGAGILSGAIDPERIGAAGHSLGAFTTGGLTYNDCCIDDDIDAAALLAGLAVPFGDDEYSWPDTPMLLIHGDADGVVAYGGSTDIFGAAQGPTYFLSLLGVDHGAGLGTEDDHNALMNEALIAFFDEYVAGVENDLDTKASIEGVSTWQTSNVS